MKREETTASMCQEKLLGKNSTSASNGHFNKHLQLFQQKHVFHHYTVYKIYPIDVKTHRSGVAETNKSIFTVTEEPENMISIKTTVFSS